MLTHYICTTCGVQYAAQEQPPEQCKVCTDDRQYVNWQGQSWTTLAEMQQTYRNEIEPVEPHIFKIQTTPKFAIGQKAHLIQSPAGNILWDCVTLLDEGIVKQIKVLGGIAAIAISHPHFYATLVNWSEAFGGVPIYLHALDKDWVMQPDSRIVFWQGLNIQLQENFKIINCGGHFPGATVLHYSSGKGVLFSGDTIQVAMDRQSVSFMYSYPNMIPLKKNAILAIDKAMEGINFERMYGAFEAHIAENARQAYYKSIARYLQIYE